MPALRKTGTTICGVVFSGGVVLGADTRATEGPLVADKNCNKLHRISNNMYAAGAGTAADLDHMCDWLATQVELHRMATHAKVRRGLDNMPPLIRRSPDSQSRNTNKMA